MYHTSADSLTTGPCLPQGWKVCSWSHNTLPHKHTVCTQHVITNSTHTHNTHCHTSIQCAPTCYNKQHTYTQHMHRTQMICTNYHHQQPSSTLSMGGRRRGKWTVYVNPVNSEQHMYYIHLAIKEQHCSGECLHRRLCHNHLMHLPFALGLQSTHLLRCLLLPVWEDCLLSGAMSKLL